MSDDHGTLSRRETLVAAGIGLAGLAGLAGCSSLPIGSDGEQEPAYDADALAQIGDGDVPDRPSAFPVSVPGEMVERHRTRARELLQEVPESPGIPNEVMAAELRHERQHVAESLDENRADGARPDRLRSGRWVREEAAYVRGAYRAATGEVDPDRIEVRRTELRADLYAFLEDWDYRGGDPANALVVHHTVEELLREVDRGVQAWPTFPETPGDAVFRVGDIAGGLERAEAALDDATELRGQYLDSLDDPVSYRSVITGASIRLERTTDVTTHTVQQYVDAEDPSFERDLEDTTARDLFDRSRDLVEWRTREVSEARQRGHHASAVLQAGTALAAIESLSAVVDAIEAGEYDTPEDASAVRSLREEAIAALSTAWNTNPVAVSEELSGPAVDSLREGTRRLQRDDIHRMDVTRSTAGFAHAKHYAKMVPPATAYLVGVLDSAK